MAKIRKSVKAKEKTFESKNFREKRHHKKSKHQNCSSSECHSDSEDVADDGEDRKNTRKSSKSYEHSNKLSPSSVRELKDRNIQKKRNIEQDMMYKEQPAHALLDSTIDNDEIREGSKRHHDKAKCDRYYLEGWMDSESGRKWRENRHAGSRDSDDMAPRRESHQKHDYKPSNFLKKRELLGCRRCKWMLSCTRSKDVND